MSRLYGICKPTLERHEKVQGGRMIVHPVELEHEPVVNISQLEGMLFAPPEIT